MVFSSRLQMCLLEEKKTRGVHLKGCLSHWAPRLPLFTSHAKFSNAFFGQSKWDKQTLTNLINLSSLDGHQDICNHASSSSSKRYKVKGWQREAEVGGRSQPSQQQEEVEDASPSGCTVVVPLCQTISLFFWSLAVGWLSPSLSLFCCFGPLHLLFCCLIIGSFELEPQRSSSLTPLSWTETPTGMCNYF